jgi:hypothetical protein
VTAMAFEAAAAEWEADAGVQQYYGDPVGFARNCITWPPGRFLTAYQCDVLEQLGKPAGQQEVHRSRVAFRGPHGLGKTMLASTAALWFALTREAAGVDWKIATTAGSWHQLTQYLWPEIHRWAGAVRWDKVRDGRPFTRLELQSLNLKLARGHIFAGASANAALIEGAHADSLMFIYDEAKAIPAGTFDACEGAFSGTGEALALAISTPGDPSGRFYDIHARKAGYEDWFARHVTLAEAVAAGRISMEWADQRRKQWGPDSAAYVNRVEGNFHAGEEDTVIPLRWVEAANERWLEWDASGRPEHPGPHVDGVDVARSGEDSTVIAIRQGPVLAELRRSSKEDTMQTTGRVKGHLDTDPTATAMVDVIGIGAGVLDRLREMGARAEAFNASAGTKNKDATGELGFANTRSAAWWLMREILDPSKDSDTALPVDDLLLGDLTAPKWKILSGGRIQVESKDDIRKRIGRSTDAGDAGVQAFWEEGFGATAWIDWMRKKAEAAAAGDSPQPDPLQPDDGYGKCGKPDCRRKVKPGVAYCCTSCATAAQAPAPYELAPYDPASHWVLVHSKDCEERSAERGELAVAAADILTDEERRRAARNEMFRQSQGR